MAVDPCLLPDLACMDWLYISRLEAPLLVSIPRCKQLFSRPLKNPKRGYVIAPFPQTSGMWHVAGVRGGIQNRRAIDVMACHRAPRAEKAGAVRRIYSDYNRARIIGRIFGHDGDPLLFLSSIGLSKISGQSRAGGCHFCEKIILLSHAGGSSARCIFRLLLVLTRASSMKR